MTDLQSQVEAIPGYDIGMAVWEEYAGEKLQTKDPFFEELPDGSTRKRKAPPGVTNDEKRAWKGIRQKAWNHDRCFCGCFWLDCGVGSAPLVSILPVIGPLCVYIIHMRLLTIAENELQIPKSLAVKIASNILFDFLITLPPVIGSILSYLNACSTRNAAMIWNYLAKRGQSGQSTFNPFQNNAQPSNENNTGGGIFMNRTQYNVVDSGPNRNGNRGRGILKSFPDTSVQEQGFIRMK